LHQVQVASVKDAVQIWGNSKLLRTHPIRHDRRKEHSAFANPVVDPTASMQPETAFRRVGAGADLSPEYRNWISPRRAGFASVSGLRAPVAPGELRRNKTPTNSCVLESRRATRQHHF